MSGPSKCVTAVVAGAMTAGIGAATVVPVPDKVETADVDLAASITIPIFDIDTPGPISISRLLTLTLTALPNNLAAILNSEAGTIYNLPGLYTNFSSAGQQTFSAIRDPGESISFGFDSQGPVDNSWNVLNGFATGNTDIEQGRALNLDLLTGGTEGIGAALGGTLAEAGIKRSLTLLGSGIAATSSRTVGDFDGQLSFMPFDGFKAVGGGTLVDVDPEATFNLGSLTGAAGGHGGLAGDAGLCLGSAGSTDSCSNGTAFAAFEAPLDLHLGAGGSPSNVFAVDIPTNLAVAVKNRQLSVTGQLGGEVSIGSLEVGRIFDVDVQIPNNTSMSSLNNTRQTSTVRNSFMATPQKSLSDNETGGRHRAGPLRQTVAEVQKAVNDAVSGKHAKPEADD